jgi:hypothetical protein
MWHDELVRGAAIRVLGATLGSQRRSETHVFDPGVEAELSLLHESVQPLVKAVVRRGAALPVVGYEVESEAADLPWVVEAAWTSKKVAILLDTDSARDRRLATEGWIALPVASWTPEKLYAAVI